VQQCSRGWQVGVVEEVVALVVEKEVVTLVVKEEVVLIVLYMAGVAEKSRPRYSDVSPEKIPSGNVVS
jgi:hypothetical protein